MSKKIILVGPAYPYRGGQALVEAHLYHMLTDLGFDCRTISYRLLYPSVFFPGTTQFDTSGIIPYEHNDRIERVINSVNPFNWFRAARRIKKMGADVVIFVWWMPFFGPALSTIARLIKGRKRKIIFLVENYVSHENRWFDRFSTKHTLNQADAFISESGFVTRQIRADFPDKPIHQATLSVYDCYDLGKYDRKSARELLNIRTGKVILFFGLIRPYKGLDKLILAFKELIAQKPDTTLLVAGECYEDEKKYTDLIRNEGLQEKVIFINKFIPNEEIEPYFKAADVVCLPYNSGTQSGILMMAYGFRIPAVVTNVGGIGELVQPGKTGVVVENNEPQNLIAGLTEVLDNPGGENYAANIEAHIGSTGYSKLQQFINERIDQ